MLSLCFVGFHDTFLRKKLGNILIHNFFIASIHSSTFFSTIYTKKINENSLIVVSLYILAGFYIIYSYCTINRTNNYYHSHSHSPQFHMLSLFPVFLFPHFSITFASSLFISTLASLHFSHTAFLNCHSL